MQRRNNNVKKQKKAANRMGETVRIASLVQKGIRSGRSSYVEMRALSRLTKQNVRTKIQNILPLLKLRDVSGNNESKSADNISEILAKIPNQAADGYTDVLTPNGNFRQEALDKLLAIDAELVTCLAMIESQLKSPTRSVADSVRALRDILKERKELIDTLRA